MPKVPENGTKKEVTELKKVLSWILMAAMLLTGVAVAEDVAPSPNAEELASGAPVVDFENDSFSFLGMDMSSGKADASELSVVDYNGGKALRVDVKAKSPFIAFNLEEMLGENLDKVHTIMFDIGVELGSDGKFYAASGKVYTYTGADVEEKTETAYDWSIYLKNKNPKTAKIVLKTGFTNGQGDYMVISKEADAFVDSKKFPGEEPRDIYIDNIRFLDANGVDLPVNLDAVYVAPVSEEADMSNLSVLSNTVELEGMTVEGGAWSQNGVEMTPEFLAALVPGSVVEIEYESEDGDIWVVMPWASAGWIRVAQGQATKNNSKTVAQITYEQFAALLGEDTSTWGAMFQCEGSSAWSVNSVKVGTPGPRLALTNTVEFAGFTCEGGAWGQNGFEFTQEVLDALQPGTALEIEFESESGDMWIVLPWSTAGWMRVQQQTATIVGNKAYVTYEQIVAAVGEDKAAWGAMLQCEASGAWSVNSVKVGKVNQLVGLTEIVNFDGFAVDGSAWGQNGLEMTDAIKAALKPGAVVTISYESESGDMWLVFPDSAAGWQRVQMMSADCDGATAQITFEEIAAVLGEDVSTWGARMQCEASGAWSVYGVTVAQAQ